MSVRVQGAANQRPASLGNFPSSPLCSRATSSSASLLSLLARGGSRGIVAVLGAGRAVPQGLAVCPEIAAPGERCTCLRVSCPCRRSRLALCSKQEAAGCPMAPEAGEGRAAAGLCWGRPECHGEPL
ncbi:unnamed protein product [Natator depressus]